jgi:hypothetical protein
MPATQPGGNGAGLADGPFCGSCLTQADEVLGSVEQAMGHVVRGGVLAQLGDCGHEVQRCPHGPLRIPSAATEVPQTAVTASPDELLHHPAVPADRRPRDPK